MINSNRLKKRVDALEAENGPKVKVIETWADLMRYAAGYFGDVDIPLSRELKKVCEDLRNEHETPTRADPEAGTD